jgi:(p)ppGpp synthase/HD superfamily hydrolase
MTGINISKNVDTAIKLVKEAHEGQFRKDGVTPYFTHPYAVAELAQKYIDGFDEVVAISALSHDCLEDVDEFDLVVFLNKIYGDDPSNHTLERKRITTLVIAMTKDVRLPSRHEKDLDSYKRLYRVGGEAVLLKLCDRLHNLSDMDGKEKPGVNIAFQRRYVAETFFMLGYFATYEDHEAYRDLLKTATKLANKLYS